MSTAATSEAAFPHLRKASPAVMALVEELRGGSRLPLDPDPALAEAARLWKIEVELVRSWARDVRIGTRSRLCPEVERWAPITRQRLGVEAEYQWAMTGGRR
jgi:hypothetical protein